MRRTYLRLLFSFGRWSSTRLPAAQDGVPVVIFVCWGNIFRSPMAEMLMVRALAARALGGVRVSSAGVNATPGREAPVDARVAAREAGVSLDAHRATRLTRELAERADILVVMDLLNDAIIAHRFPEAAAKIVPLGAFETPVPKGLLATVIHDPYGEGLEAVRGCYARLDRCIDGLTEAITRQSLSTTTT